MKFFFVGLPLEEERKLIFSVHLSKLRPDSWQNFNINILSQESKNFSGAEIQQSIIEGMHSI
jgi:SpoVK/Ycf46/Vps4 family AAA+-type ATPase